MAGGRVKVLGEAYTPDDDEDMAFATVSNVWIPRGRSRTEVMMARAGNWVLLGGVDADIVKTATKLMAGKAITTHVSHCILPLPRYQRRVEQGPC